MKRIHVKAYEKALLFKDGQLTKVLNSGKYWISFSYEVTLFDVTEMFYHEMELDLLIQNEDFKASVDVLEIGDSEIAIQYKSGNFHQVLGPGRYCFWKEGLAYTYDKIDLLDIYVPDSINRKILHLAPVARYLTVHAVESYEVGMLFIDGQFEKALSAGIYYFWKGEKNAIINKVDMRKQQVEISGQELLTKDKAAIRINFFAYYKVIDAINAISTVKDFAKQLYVMLQLGVREYVGQYSLDDLLANKASASLYVLDKVKTLALEIGVELLDCGIRDIILPGDMKEIMNQVLIAEKKAQANVIMRREETASTRSLLNTAKLMENNEMLFKLKEMEYIEKISEKVGEISLNGGNQVMHQLRNLMSTGK